MTADRVLATAVILVAGCADASPPVEMSEAATLVTQCSLSAQHIHEWAALAEDRRATDDQKSKIRLAADLCGKAERAISGTALESACSPVVSYLATVNRALSAFNEGRFVPDLGQDSPRQPSGSQTQACLDAMSPFSNQAAQ